MNSSQARRFLAQRGCTLRYRVHLTPDDSDTLLVTCLDLPEVTTFGDDQVSARLHAVDAILSVLQARMSRRHDVPEPTTGDGEWIELGALAEAKVGLYRAMQRVGVTKAELARRLDWHPPSVDRLLDLDHDTRFRQVELAFQVIGRQVRIVDEAA